MSTIRRTGSKHSADLLNLMREEAGKVARRNSVLPELGLVLRGGTGSAVQIQVQGRPILLDGSVLLKTEDMTLVKGDRVLLINVRTSIWVVVCKVENA